MPLDLPDEVLEVILGDVDGLDLVQSCQQVNKQFRYLIKSNISLQLRIKCAMANVVPSNSSKFTKTEILQAVREYYESWRTLSWKGRSTLKIPYDAMNWSVGPNIDAAAPSLVLHFDEPRQSMLAIFRTPSELRRVPYDVWATPDICFWADMWAVDAGQDLFVATNVEREAGPKFACIKLHIFSLSTGLPHPSSMGILQSTGTTTFGRPVGCTALALAISGCHVGQTSFSGQFGEANRNYYVHVWNWKTGAEKLIISFPTSMSARDITFLSEDRILISTTTEARTCELGVVEINGDLRQGAYADLGQAKFCFPKLQAQTYCSGLRLFCTKNTSCKPPPGLDIPFYPSDDSRILLFSMRFSEKHNDHIRDSSATYQMFVRASALGRLCQDISCAEGPVSFAWSTWSQHARLESENDNYSSIHMTRVSHSRMLETTRTIDGGISKEDQESDYFRNRAPAATIRDFLPPIALRRDLEELITPDDCRNALEPSVLDPQWVFEGKVKSYLPYREVNLNLRFENLKPRAIVNDGVIALPTVGGLPELCFI
ncbi:hypothetical protein BDY19DRAFT_951584 [Irpex rosettiformis]|uniref:Uncharacterized protein n=1 Tax=Irpex rosettiformis TaxID=378272 RepID=A0ACB8U0Y8_9APHY|nr:hypothetical protein BDY19DRAFT_951584 [Irpex rosettiformis]